MKSYFCRSESKITRLPCGQGQLSRIWKVQCDWLSMGKECCLRLSRRLWGGMKNELPKKRLRGRLDLNAHKSIGSNMRALVLLTFKIGDVNKRQSLKIYTLKCDEIW